MVQKSVADASHISFTSICLEFDDLFEGQDNSIFVSMKLKRHIVCVRCIVQ